MSWQQKVHEIEKSNVAQESFFFGLLVGAVGGALIAVALMS